MGHTETQRQRHRDTETQRQRHRDTETQRHRDTDTQRQRHRDVETSRHRDTETQRQSHRDTETQRHIYTHITHLHTYTHIYTHIFIHIHTYTHISKQSRHTWIYRVASWYISILLRCVQGPLGRHPGPLWKSWFLLQVLANIDFFDLWIHHIIYKNLIFCSTSHVLFTFSISCRYMISSCSFKNVTKH